MSVDTPVPAEHTPPDPDEIALRYLIENVRPGQWLKASEALKTIKDSGGYGTITLTVKDGFIQGRVKFEGSL